MKKLAVSKFDGIDPDLHPITEETQARDTAAFAHIAAQIAAQVPLTPLPFAARTASIDGDWVPAWERASEELGDSPGHPFRGNQWKEGEGSDKEGSMNISGPMQSLRENGGFTITTAGERITTGVAVAMPGVAPSGKMDRSTFYADKAAAREFMRSYVREHRETLAPSGIRLGGWDDVKHGEIVLDHVEVFAKERIAEAIQAGRDRNEQSVYSIDPEPGYPNGREIDTGGTGEGVI